MAQRPSIAANNNLFPALISWRDKKLKDLCYSLTTFFNYIAAPREGFSIVDNTPKNPMTVFPVITREMANYVIGEIFPCSTMVKENTFNVFKVPSDIAEIIEQQIRINISDRSLLRDKAPVRKSVKPPTGRATGLIIEAGVIQMIWTYLSNGIDSLADGLETNEQIIDRIGTAKEAILSMRNSSMNYGFNDDTENCAFQAILYVIVAISDWLEVEEIGDIEIQTAYKILYPRSLQSGLSSSEDKRYENFIRSAIISKNLVPIEHATQLISSMMFDVSRRMNNLGDEDSRRIINRFMSLAQPV